MKRTNVEILKKIVKRKFKMSNKELILLLGGGGIFTTKQRAKTKTLKNVGRRKAAFKTKILPISMSVRAEFGRL